MKKEEKILLLNKYQGMINSKVSILLNKAKTLKEKDLNEDIINSIDYNVQLLKKSEAKVIRLLNKYCGKLNN